MENNIINNSEVLCLKISVAQKILIPGKYFPVDITIENHSDQTIAIPYYGEVVCIENHLLDFRLQYAGDQQKYKINLVRPNEKKSQTPDPKRKILTPGEFWHTNIDFNNLAPVIKTGLAMGNYELQAVWTGGYWNQTGELLKNETMSNTVTLVLKTDS